MVKHLCWSLLGIAELEPLDSVDSPSVNLAHFLFGAFLVMGVVLLVNMMIALLSNTYQRVQVRILYLFSAFFFFGEDIIPFLHRDPALEHVSSMFLLK